MTGKRIKKCEFSIEDPSAWIGLQAVLRRSEQFDGKPGQMIIRDSKDQANHDCPDGTECMHNTSFDFPNDTRDTIFH